MKAGSASNNQIRSLEDALDACVRELSAGASLEDCLTQYPSFREELEPLLSLALGLQSLRQQPAPATLQAGRRGVLQEAARLGRAQTRSKPRLRLPSWLSLQPLMQRGVAATVLASLLLVFVLGSGAAAVAASSLPGDALYPVKRITEEVRLLLAFDEQMRAQVIQELEERRREEAKAIASIRRVAEVSFGGVVEEIDNGRWTIGGVPIELSDKTVMVGDVGLGTVVRVQVRSLSDGTLLALRIEPDAGDDALLPSPTYTPPPPTPTVTATATYTKALPTSAVQQQLGPSQTPPPTVTPLATETQVPTVTPTPTITPVPPRPVKVSFKGRIEAMEPSAWTVDGQAVRLDSNTKIGPQDVPPVIGAMASVVAVRTEDGGLLALEITVEPVAQATEQPFEFQGLIERFGATEWVVGGHTLLITADTAIENAPQIGLLAEVKALRRGDGSLIAVQIRVQLPSEVVQFEGTIQSLGAVQWTVEGVTVRLDGQTQVVGDPAIGSRAEVEGLLLPDDSVLARKIVVQAVPTPTPTAEPSEAPSEQPTPSASQTAEQVTGEPAATSQALLEPVPRTPQVPLRVGPQPSPRPARRDAAQTLVRQLHPESIGEKL